MQDGLPDGQPRTVVITGLPHQIQLAKQLISSVISDGPSAIQSPGVEFDPAEPIETQEMTCPPEKVGLVIGSKGIVVQDIMRRSACKITVNQNFPEGEPRVVVITGRPSNIEFAMSLVNLVITNGPAALNQTNVGVNAPGYVTEDMDCPHERVGIVIGAKGTIVQDIMRRTGSRIVVQQDFPDGHPRKVVITGSLQQVRAAKQLVSAVIVHGPVAIQGPQMMNHGPPMGYGNSVIQDLKIVQSQVGKLIGPGGSTIKDLQLRFAVKMNIDQLLQDSDERRLRITGDPTRVQAASQMIWHILHSNTPPLMHPGMQGQMSQGYGMHGGDGYNDPSGMMHGAYYNQMPPQHNAYPPANHMPPEPIHPSHAPAGQGLGADGSSGRLMPPTPLNNGLVHQIVYIIKGLMPRILGPNNSIMYLILVKSGANIEIEAATVLATGGQEMTKINLVGVPNGVTLAGQMIQEVLINGPDKLSALPDAPQVFGYENPNFPQQQQQQLPPQNGGHMSVGSRQGRGDQYGYAQQSARLPQGIPANSGYPPQQGGGGYGHMPQSPNMIPEQGPGQYPPVYSNRIDPYSREPLPQQYGGPGTAPPQYPNQSQYPGPNFGSLLQPGSAQQYQSTPPPLPPADNSTRPLLSNPN